MLRTVTLELLRHGPAHNQLLSPLTPYLALCGNHDAETVRVDFEHLQLMQRIRVLGFQQGVRAAHAARADAAERISSTLGQIRALSIEVANSRNGNPEMIHLQLVLSASELSLIPFELMNAPPGFPGQGSPLCLQASMPISLTRRVRRVDTALMKWPDAPRILVIAAQPDDVPPVPLRAHLLALRRALDPWLVSGSSQELARHLTVVPRATAADVQHECARSSFTHVHVLAHGVPASDLGGIDRAFKLAFHDEVDRRRTAPLSGEELAAVICCGRASQPNRQRPVVVTLASCDSGNQGSVLAPGASIAHDLHQAGIPFVLASQFPLSVMGSTIMCETFYTLLLQGVDPRVVVHELRRALWVRSKSNHDWASLVAYAALPADLEQQVQQSRMNQARRALQAAMAANDLKSYAPDQRKKRLSGAWTALLEAVPHDACGPREGRIFGVLASASKRLAQFCVADTVREDAGAEPRLAGRDELMQAKDYYRKAFRTLKGESWAVVQYLALDAVLDPPPDTGDAAEPRLREFVNLWTTGYVLASEDALVGRGDGALWAHAALIELYVLAQLLPPDHWAREQGQQRAEEHVDRMLAVDENRFESYASRLQLVRYRDWWWKDRPDLRALPAHLAQRLLERGIPEVKDGTRTLGE